MKQLNKVLPIAVLSLGAVVAHSAVVFHFSDVYTGDIPDGGAPFATVTITDVAMDTVRLRLDHNATSGEGQFLTQLNLNLTSIPDSIMFTNYENEHKFALPITYGNDFFVDAGLKFDMKMQFQVSNAGGGVNRLKPGEYVSVDMTASGLNENWFMAYATPAGDNKPVLSMLHLQGISDGGSSKLEGVPEPATLTALGIGLTAFFKRRKKESV